MSVVAPADSLVQPRRRSPGATWFVVGGAIVAAGTFAFVLDDVIGVAAWIAAAIGISYLVFVTVMVEAIRRAGIRR